MPGNLQEEFNFKGSVPWRGALTEVLTAAVYCISTLPLIIYHFADGFVNENPPGQCHVHYHRISVFLIVANFYILYVLINPREIEVAKKPTSMLVLK